MLANPPRYVKRHFHADFRGLLGGGRKRRGAVAARRGGWGGAGVGAVSGRGDDSKRLGR